MVVLLFSQKEAMEMDPEITEYPLDGVLDLHTFHPRDAADVTKEYINACHDAGIRHVQIIHGKGTGALRAIVHKVLKQSPLVDSWKTPADSSSWGATVAVLKRPIDSRHA